MSRIEMSFLGPSHIYPDFNGPDTIHPVVHAHNTQHTNWFRERNRYENRNYNTGMTPKYVNYLRSRNLQPLYATPRGGGGTSSSGNVLIIACALLAVGIVVGS